MSLDTTPDQWLTLIISRAAELRAAGIRSMTIAGVSFTLDAPPPEELKSDRNNHFDDEPIDVFQDPATYGRAAGVPGFTRPKDE